MHRIVGHSRSAAPQQRRVMMTQFDSACFESGKVENSFLLAVRDCFEELLVVLGRSQP